MNKPNRLINFLREASAGGQTIQRTQQLKDRVAGAQNDIFALNKLAETVKKEEADAGRNALIQNAKAQGVDLTPNAQGGATAVYQGKTYNLQGPSEGGKPFVPSNPVNVQTLRTQTIETGGPTAKNPMVPVSPRGGNTQTQTQVSASAPVYSSNRPNPSATIQQPKADFSQYTNLTNQVQTPKIPSLTPDQYLQLSPEQQQAYRQMGFEQNVQNQIGGLNQMYGKMSNVFDQRASGIQSEIEQLQQQKNNPQLTEQEKLAIEELQAQKEKAIQLQQQASQKGAENINESLSFSGFGRSTKRADLLADNQTNLETAIADISRKYAEGEASIRTQALERGNKEIERLQARLDKTQDQRDALELDKFSKAFSLQQELFKQDPSNPENMMKVAEQLQTTRLAEAKLKQDELKAARDDAQENFKFMVDNFDSSWVNNMSKNELENMASNIGMPVSVLKNMGKTLKEQESEWEQLKYQIDRQDKFDIQANTQAFQMAMNDLNFKQDIQKLGINFQNDLSKLYLGEQFKTEADARKYAGLSYGSYASNAVDVQPQTGGLVMESGAIVQPKLKDAYPAGYKKISPTNKLIGECAYEAGQMVSPPNGKGNMVYGMDMKAKKANLAKYVQQGQAFYGWNGQPQVGFSIISNDSKDWGHVSIVNEVRPDRSVVVSEFNRGKAKTFTNNRVIPAGDKSVIGFIKTKPQAKYAVPQEANKVMDSIKKDPLVGTASSVLGITSLGKMFGAMAQTLPQAGVNLANKQAMQSEAQTYLPQTGQMQADFEAGLIDEQGQQITPDRQAVRSGAMTLANEELSALRRINPQAYSQYMQDLTFSKSNKSQQTDFTQANQLYNRYKSTGEEIRSLDQGMAVRKQFDVNTTNPYDDQALIFSFMKVLDPGSVVREGEFVTAQKNASALESLGAGWQQAVQGTGMLTKEQRQRILSTMDSMYSQKMKSYGDLVTRQAQSGAKLGVKDPSLFMDFTPDYFNQNSQPQMGGNDDMSLYQGVSGGGGMTTQSDLDYYNSL